MCKRFAGRSAIILLILCMFVTLETKGQGLELKGQVSSWGTWNRLNSNWNGSFGIRYIPQFNYSYSISEDAVLNAELLFNTYYGTDLKRDDYAFKFYRTILRYTSTQTEVQLGLQKINFGPAQLLRPLMWFDKVDPRDPLKLTDGVYGLRYKYSFMDNSILWLWGLYGNKDEKGYELFPTADNTPEFGGRFQTPVPAGEMGVTFHTRKVNFDIFNQSFFNYRENRYSLDGRWDIGIGLWFESVLQQSNYPQEHYPRENILSFLPLFKWSRMTTIGGDYTIPIGNGMYILAEHMQSSLSNSFWTTEDYSNISAMMITYPIGVLDNVAVQEYFNWQDKNIYQYYQWQRTYDNFIINTALFHYPENGSLMFSRNSSSLPVSGYGVQVMVIYNY